MNINGDLQKRFDNVQQSLRPDSVHMLLNLQDKSTIEKNAENLVSALERLDSYIKNGDSTEGLAFSYEKVEEY
jgi:hypothetical protein